MLKIVLKKFAIIGFVLLVSACNPVAKKSTATHVSTLVPQCIRSQSQCEFTTELGSFTVKFSQQQLADTLITELPFFITLSELNASNVLEGVNEEATTEPKANTQSSQVNISNVSAYLEGKDMFMGKVPVFFEQTDKSNTYSAQSLLASCSEEFMVWRLWITLDIAEQSQTFFVDFTSQRL